MGAALSCLGLAQPYVAKLFFDNVYPARDTDLLNVLVLGVLALSIASALMGSLRGYYMKAVSGRASRALSLMFFNHLQHLPIRFYDRHRVGEVMSRFADVRGSFDIVSRGFETLVLSGMHAILVPPILLILNPRLALLAIAGLPVLTVVSLVTARVIRRYTKQGAEAGAELNAFQIEALTHVRTVKSMALEPVVCSSARAQLGNVLQLQMKIAGASALAGIASAVLRGGAFAVFSWYSWRLILRQEMTLGDYVAFTGYIGYLSGPLTQLSGLFIGFQQAAVTFGRMFEYLDIQPEQPPTSAYQPHAAIAHRLSGELRIERVSFGYDEQRPLFEDLSLHFGRDTLSVIVGASGCGKSTLLRLICRLESHEAGQILFDGTPAESIPLADLRRQLGTVWQDAAMFRGTLGDNLTLGLTGVRQRDIDEVIELCQLTDVVGSLPQRYSTQLAESGASLSAGQRQRIALARALLRDTQFLLLDEATANVDLQTEEAILRHLLERSAKRTLLIVTHRVQTARFADQVVFFGPGGRVVTGSHDALYEADDHYRALAESGLRVVRGSEPAREPAIHARDFTAATVA